MKNEELRNEECARRGLDVIGTFFFETQKEQKAQKVFTKVLCFMVFAFHKITFVKNFCAFCSFCVSKKTFVPFVFQAFCVSKKHILQLIACSFVLLVFQSIRHSYTNDERPSFIL